MYILATYLLCEYAIFVVLLCSIFLLSPFLFLPYQYFTRRIMLKGVFFVLYSEEILFKILYELA